jgi:hypothetical protein
VTYAWACSLYPANSAARPRTVQDLPTEVGTFASLGWLPNKLIMFVQSAYAKVSSQEIGVHVIMPCMKTRIPELCNLALGVEKNSFTIE